MRGLGGGVGELAVEVDDTGDVAVELVDEDEDGGLDVKREGQYFR
jgi:hypothetical protein